MILKSIKYAEYTSNDRAWHLDNFDAGPINLLVGKNASGKTRTINLIFGLANLVCGDSPFRFANGNYEARFDNNGDMIEYRLTYEDGLIVSEKFVLNSHVLLDRGKGGMGSIYANELDRDIKFQVPNDQLACVSRRDDVQHPFFQSLFDWGKSTLLYNFGSLLGKDSIALLPENENKEEMLNLKDTNNVVRIFGKGGSRYGDIFKASIVNSMHDIGYDIEDVGTGINPDMRLAGQPKDVVNLASIFVKERDLGDRVYQMQISQGMFRCLSLFIQIYYAQMSSTPHLLLIDDVGEGLDYERSTALITILIGIARKSSVQLVMSSNDRFVMNAVPLPYWSVIQRTGGHCKVFNYGNSKKLFDEFEYTGLSNFDFFATDFKSQDIDNI